MTNEPTDAQKILNGLPAEKASPKKLREVEKKRRMAKAKATKLANKQEKKYELKLLKAEEKEKVDKQKEIDRQAKAVIEAERLSKIPHIERFDEMLEILVVFLKEHPFCINNGLRLVRDPGNLVIYSIISRRPNDVWGKIYKVRSYQNVYRGSLLSRLLVHESLRVFFKA